MVDKYAINLLSHSRRKKFKTHLNKIIDFLMVEPLTLKELSEKIGYSYGYTREMISYLEYDGKIVRIDKFYELRL